MPALSTPFHRRRLFHGAGECLAIGPVTVPWAGAGSLGGCQVRPRRDCQIPGDCIHGESPRGGGGWNIPLPCLLSQPLNGFRWITPTARRVPRLLPPPSEGAGS